MTPLHHQIDVGKNSVATPRVSHFHRGINILDQKLGHVEYIYICYESMRLFAIQYGFMMAELSSPTMGMIDEAPPIRPSVQVGLLLLPTEGLGLCLLSQLRSTCPCLSRDELGEVGPMDWVLGGAIYIYIYLFIYTI